MTCYEGECPTCNKKVEIKFGTDECCPHCEAKGFFFEDSYFINDEDEEYVIEWEWDYNI